MMGTVKKPWYWLFYLHFSISNSSEKTTVAVKMNSQCFHLAHNAVPECARARLSIYCHPFASIMFNGKQRNGIKGDRRIMDTHNQFSFAQVTLNVCRANFIFLFRFRIYNESCRNNTFGEYFYCRECFVAGKNIYQKLTFCQFVDWRGAKEWEPKFSNRTYLLRFVTK